MNNENKLTNSMKNDTSKKSLFKKVKNVLNYIGKIISSSFLVILILIGAFLFYYFISAKIAASNPEYKPKLNIYTIVSGSMEPAIKVYDVVIDVAVNSPEDIKVGDVITFISTSSISNGLVVTHRVQDIKVVNGNYEYVTKGDFNGSADSDTAKFDNIIGKVAFKVPQLGRIQFFVASKLGWFVVVLVPAFGVIVFDVIKLIKLMTAKSMTKNVKSNDTKKVLTGDMDVDNVLLNINKTDLPSDNLVLHDLLKNNNDDSSVVKEDNIDIPQNKLTKEDLVGRLNNLKNK